MPSASAKAPNRQRFCLVLIKPTHYCDDGYPIRWFRSAIPSNSLACLYGIAQDCAEHRVLGDDVDIEIHALDESNTRIRPDRIAALVKAADALAPALEARGLNVVPVFCSGLDMRSAIETYMTDANGMPTVDALWAVAQGRDGRGVALHPPHQRLQEQPAHLVDDHVDHLDGVGATPRGRAGLAHRNDLPVGKFGEPLQQLPPLTTGFE